MKKNVEKVKQGGLIMSFGKTTTGENFLVDFFKLPHLLIAGRTGSGKSNFIHYIISQLMDRFRPEEMRFVLADPKQVELIVYKSSPYLLMPVVLYVNRAITALDWLVAEMQRRFEVLDDANVSDISLYNQEAKEKMPYIFFIADEISDFMVTKERGVRKHIEERLTRISVVGRAVGVHMIIATSRISQETLPAMLVVNILGRLVFQTATKKNSRWIIGCPDAEQLTGNGDALFSSYEQQDVIRLQTPLYKEE